VAVIAVENVKFKEKYPKYILNSLYAAIVLHFLAFYFSPPFEFQPYVLKEREFVAIETTEQFELPPPPEEVAQPVVPTVAEEGEEAQDASEVAPTSFDDIDQLPEPPAAESEETRKFYAFDEKPILIKTVPVRYPELAKQAQIEGTVMLRVVIDEKGKVIRVSVLTSDVTTSMEKAAMAAVRQYRFRPAKQRMQPVKAAVAIPVRFTLN